MAWRVDEQERSPDGLHGVREIPKGLDFREPTASRVYDSSLESAKPMKLTRSRSRCPPVVTLGSVRERIEEEVDAEGPPDRLHL